MLAITSTADVGAGVGGSGVAEGSVAGGMVDGDAGRTVAAAATDSAVGCALTAVGDAEPGGPVGAGGEAG